MHIVVSGRAKDYLSKRFENVHGIWGLTLAYEGNSVKKLQTLCRTSQGAVKGWPQNIRQYFELAEKFKPDVVVSDFESFSYLFAQQPPAARHQRRQHADHQPLQARRRRCSRGHEDALRAHARHREGQAARRLPLPRHHVLLPARCARTAPRCSPSILRPEILAAKSRARRAPARVPDRRPRNTRAARTSSSRAGCRAASTACAGTSPRTCVDGNLLYRPFSESGLHRRPAHRARGDRRRRLHADERGRLPAQAHARACPSRASSSRCSTRSTSRSWATGMYAKELTPGRAEGVPRARARLRESARGLRRRTAT